MCMWASTQPGKAKWLRASKTCSAIASPRSSATRATFPPLMPISSRSTEVRLGRTTRAFLITRSNSFSMSGFLAPPLSARAGAPLSVRDPLARLAHDRRPALDVLAHEVGELARAVADRGRALGLEVLPQLRIVQRRDDHHVELLGDSRRKTRRPEHAEPGARLEPGHDFTDRRNLGAQGLS